MIRRLWRWLIDDDRDAFLRESASLMADQMRKLTDQQQADLFATAPEVWWHANRVAACVDLRAKAGR
ncbi:hypothetical protein [Nonomuraea sp. GTA35]|uniref:hypothetical protein n=1 Tax=Nonomuraea sp. GTA35 TaxID=1676746 RepID=UPI0035BFBF79